MRRRGKRRPAEPPPEVWEVAEMLGRPDARRTDWSIRGVDLSEFEMPEEG